MSINQSAYQKLVEEIFNLQIFAIKLGLDNIRALCNALAEPQKQYPVIHIAGTNGKGSTSFFVAAFLQQAGLRCGLFTSPHLVDFRERITINGEKISKDFIARFWSERKDLIYQRKATFFDTTTALGLAWFADQQVDVAVVETGLGGRLDSTNIVDPVAAVITPIDFDHEKQLGNTIPAISAEKAGIIKPGSVVFSARQPEPALSTLRAHLVPEQKFFYLPQCVTINHRKSDLQGNRFDLNDLLRNKQLNNLYSSQIGIIQTENQALAYLVARWFLEENQQPFSMEMFQTALRHRVWPGRLQKVSEQPAIFFDVSHNLAGIGHTLRFIGQFVDPQHLHVLIGLVEDKNSARIAELVASFSEHITVTEPRTHRRLSAARLAGDFKASGKEVQIIKDLSEAYELCKGQIKKGQTLLVFGSHYLIGALSEHLN